MTHFPIPTRTEQEDFLIRLYFGAGTDYLRLCVERAYLDFSRTLHGIDDHPQIRQPASDEVEKLLVRLRDDAHVDEQEAFDAWHHRACHYLSSFYAERGYNAFYAGQAQKWLNMSLKYVYVMGSERLPGYERLYRFCHVPLDNRIIDRLQRKGAPLLSDRWSRLRKYDEYLRYQCWIRNAFANSVPLAVEFRLWQEDDGTPIVMLPDSDTP